MRVTAAFLFLLSSSLAAAGVDYIGSGWDHFYNLEFDQALEDFQKASAQDPNDLNAHNHIAQTIMFRLMHRAGALESELVTGTNPFLRRAKMEPTAEEHRRFFQEIDFVLGAARQRLAKNPNDTAALYAQGVAFGFRANYNFLVRKAYLDSLRDATNGRKALDRVAALDPSNVDARLGQGAHEYVIGSLSLAFRIVGFLAGFHGDRENGIRIIRMVAQKGRLNRLDAELMLAAIYRRERRPKDAIPLLNDMIRRFPRNYLLRFELSQMYADSIDKDSALRVLDEIEKLKRSAAPGYRKLPIERVYFSRGVVQFWYRDFNDAVENLKRVTASAPDLDLNTATTAWLRLGQTYDLLGQRPLAEQAYRSGIALAPQSEQARECRGYLSSPYKRKI